MGQRRRPLQPRPGLRGEEHLSRVVGEVPFCSAPRRPGGVPRPLAVLAQRPPSLGELVRQTVGELPAEDRFRAIGRVTALCGEVPVARVHERPWVPIDGRLQIQDWAFSWSEERARARGRKRR